MPLTAERHTGSKVVRIWTDNRLHMDRLYHIAYSAHWGTAVGMSHPDLQSLMLKLRRARKSVRLNPGEVSILSMLIKSYATSMKFVDHIAKFYNDEADALMRLYNDSGDELRFYYLGLYGAEQMWKPPHYVTQR